MDSFDNIKQVWLSAKVTDLPNAAKIIETIKKYRLRQLLKTAGVTLVIIFLLITMCSVLFNYHSQLFLTRVGEIFILTAICILLSVNIRSLKRISASKTFSNSDFLVFLKDEKLRFARYQEKTQKIGFAFASFGLLFYIFEEVHTQFTVMALSYGAVICWCGFSWFVIRPKASKRKIKKLNETIEKFEQFSKQLQNQSN